MEHKIGDKVKAKFGCENTAGHEHGTITRIIEGWGGNFYCELNNSGVFYPERALSQVGELNPCSDGGSKK